jgi:REP element-mobilizing transposase RayT
MKHRKPNRLKGYDYSQDNLYFVTSCVHDMVCCFGVVTDRDLSIDDSNTGTGHDLSIDDSDTGTGRDLSLREPQMILNEYGKIAEQQWHWLVEQYAFVVLHEFIVMPNHIHGIIEINRNAVGTGRDLAGNAKDANVGTGRDLSVPKIKSLSKLMGAYKTTVSKQIHLAGYAEFAWQRSFYDHIIGDEKSYKRISNYIIDNPKTWDKDKFFR